ncbi:MAG: nitrogen regulation protein NR(II) [Syntrophobacteraceae bacterium]
MQYPGPFHADTEVKLSHYLSRRLLPLALLISFFISSIPPLFFLLMEHRGKQNIATLYAREFAERMQTLALAHPKLWKFQAQKYSLVLHGFLPHKEITLIEVMDENGEHLSHYAHRPRKSEHWYEISPIVGEAAVVFNNRRIGEVRVGISPGSLYSDTLCLFLAFSAIGVLLSFTVYKIPMKLACGAESRINELLHGIAEAKDALEVKVENRTAELRAAKQTLEFEIAERKQAELFLWERESYFRSLLSSMHEDILVVDSEYRICDATKTSLASLGKKQSDIIGLPCYKAVHGREAPCMIKGRPCPLKSVFQTGQPLSSRNQVVVNDLTTWTNISISPLRDNHGVTTSAIVAVRDITYEVELEERFIQTQKMEAMGTLAGGIAHDFNNILGIIMGYTEITLLTLPEGTEKNNLNQVLGACCRARDVIKQILTFSRKGEQEREPFHLIPVIEEVLSFLKAGLPASIEIRRKYELPSPDSDIIAADSTQMHQVIMNLCTNAGHAMHDKGGILEVSLSEGTPPAGNDSLEAGRNPCLLLSVRDTGHGMEQRVLDRIFEPYFTTRKPGEGTGLGLAVTHGIVKGHGGTITADSRPDEGTCFQIYLPRTEGTATSGGKEPHTSEKGRKSILDANAAEPDPDFSAVVMQYGCSEPWEPRDPEM